MNGTKTYYEKSLYFSIFFSILFFLVGLIGVLLILISPASFAVGLCFCCIGGFLTFFSLIVLFASLCRKIVLFEDGFEWFFSDDITEFPRKRKVYFDEITSITEAIHEAVKPNILLILISFIIGDDCTGSTQEHSKFTLHTKFGLNLYTYFYGFKSKNREEIIFFLDRKINYERKK